jgi:hypothetical protein
MVQVNELFKIPNLIEHYNEHQEKEPNVGLLQFICMHYMHGEVNDDDSSKDMKLPFKSHTTDCQCNIVFYPAVENYNFIADFFHKEYKPQSFKYTISFSSNYLSSIWQPPQLS